jgi:hypothetical protein
MDFMAPLVAQEVMPQPTPVAVAVELVVRGQVPELHTLAVMVVLEL